MNFLAHLYLSGEDESIRIGNFVGDWVKGSDYKKFPADIQKGIILHRSIDYYTDNHPTVKKSKKRFSEKYQKYAGIIIDICYDHFLAKDWDSYCRTPLPIYTQVIKKSLFNNMEMFSMELQEFIPKFLNYGWMESYPTISGIHRVLTGMAKNTSLPDKTDDAIKILERDYKQLRLEFYDYFPLLIDYIEEKFEISIKSQINTPL